MQRFFYSLFWYLLLPLVLLRLWRRSRRAPAYAEGIAQRFGRVSVQSGSPLWIHAVSVGETVAIAPLVELFLQRHPEIPILITNMTPTGAARVKALFGDRVQQCYCPYDLPHAMSRFMRRVRPRGLVVVETELWPNMLAACEQNQVPVLLANARLSARSARGYARFSTLTRSMLQQISRIAAQNSGDGQRFVELGLPEPRLSVTGSIKFDIRVPDSLSADAALLKQAWGEQRPVLVAGSTHEGEEAALLEMYQQCRQQYPDLLLVLVPRHPERFESVAQLVAERGVTLCRRSRAVAPTEDTQVYLGDTMGELMMLYQTADLVFVGGSLIERGGHNPLEPAALEKPVVTGPHLFNFQQIADALRQSGGLDIVEDAPALAEWVTEQLSHPEQAAAKGAAAAAFVAENRGALERLYQLVEAECLEIRS